MREESSGIVVLGIDEAGRGPVIGDMFVAGVAINPSMLQRLRELGIRDSKELTPSARSRLVTIVLRYAEAVIVKRFPPSVIDKTNINVLYAKAVIDLVNNILRIGLQIKKIYVDAVTGRKALAILKGGISKIPFVLEPKADRKYVVVSAASIVAKFLRDLHVSKLKEMYGDFGSGYPADPRTIEWLEKHLIDSSTVVPSIIRRSWSTLKRFGITVTEKKQDRGLSKWFEKSKGGTL